MRPWARWAYVVIVAASAILLLRAAGILLMSCANGRLLHRRSRRHPDPRVFRAVGTLPVIFAQLVVLHRLHGIGNRLGKTIIPSLPEHTVHELRTFRWLA